MATKKKIPSKTSKKTSKKPATKSAAKEKKKAPKAKASAKSSKTSALKRNVHRVKNKVETQVKKFIKKAEKAAGDVLAPLHQEDSTASEILKKIREALSPSHLNLKNLSASHKKHPEAKKSGGGHYSLSVVSDVFSGLDLQSRQRWVLNLLSEQMGKAIHALQMELRSPEEVPLSKESGAPLRRDLKIKPDKPGAARGPVKAVKKEEPKTVEKTQLKAAPARKIQEDDEELDQEEIEDEDLDDDIEVELDEDATDSVDADEDDDDEDDAGEVVETEDDDF